MLGLIALAAVIVTVAWWMSSRERLTPVEQVFEDQPAELVTNPEDFLVSPPLGNGECPQLFTRIFAVNVVDGSIAWEQTVPSPRLSFHGEWYVLSDEVGTAVLVQIDREVDELPPSVRAIDIKTGDLAWQRFLEATEVQRSAQTDSELVMETLKVDDRLESATFGLDVDGQLTGSPPVQFDRDQPFDPAAQLGVGYRLTSNVADVMFDGKVVRQVYTGGSGGRIEVRTVADGSVTTGDPIPFGDDFDNLGASSSLGQPIQATDDLILAVLGSPVGPNTRLAVFDGADGGLKWSIDDTRAGAIAGDQILYDKRNEAPVDADSTRDLYLVDGDDPEKVIWSTALSVNDLGGNGFLGMAGDDLVFAVESDRFALEFLRIGDEGDVPELLRAAEGFGSGWSGVHHVDEDILLAATSDGFRVETAAGELIGFETVEPVSWVRRVGDRVLVVAVDSAVCGG